MSVFSEVNDDATSIRADQVTFGPRLGFLGAFEASYEAQTRAASMFGIEKAWVDLEQEQIDNIRKAGGNPHKTLSGVDYSAFLRRNPWEGAADYVDAARYFVDGEDKGAQKVAEFDAQVGALRQQFPDLKLRTAREMFDEVRTRAQSAERTANQAPTTLMGDVGGFLGGAVGAFNLKTDPFNVITAPIGGSGKTVAGRVAGQVGAQGVIETINQVTGVQEERRLLGLDHGFAQGAAQVATTALGAGVLQGVGEGVAALGKRWFRSTPNDPAPPPPVRQETPASAEAPKGRADQDVRGGNKPVMGGADEEARAQRLIDDPEEFARLLQERSPLGQSRAAQARTVLDVENVTRALEDWNGPRPWEVGPRSAAPEVRPAEGVQIANLDATVERLGVDAAARAADPDTFRMYDRLADRKQQLQRWIDELQEPRQAEADKTVADLSDEISRLQERVLTSNRKNAKKYEARISELRAERDAIVQEMTTRDTPDMALVRKELITTDEQMRDLAPVVSRAYAHARDAWALGADEREAVRQMMRRGDKALPERAEAPKAEEGEAPRPAPVVPPTITEKVPLLATRPDIVDAMPGADAADVVSKIVADNAKVLEETVEGIRNSIDSVLKASEDNKLTLEGFTYKLDLDDRITIPNDDGSVREVSVREYLEDLKRDNDELQSVATCSIKPRS